LNYHLAIDIGASGGRAILGYICDGKLRLNEIYRFENKLIKSGSSLIWDIESLVKNVKEGIRKCGEVGKIPTTVSIDCFGVDYVLLNKDLREILPVYAYRDSRTVISAEEVEKIISRDELYSKTGIQRQTFNTIYQLYSDKMSGRLACAEYFLMLPSYLTYKLTGVSANEYTNATTTGLVNAKTQSWDIDIIERLGYPEKLFTSLFLPNTFVGNFTEEIKDYVGFDASVIFCGSHDTASAVAACPIDKQSIYLSSGTWSLIGVENDMPILTNEAKERNFTNEGGVNGKYRFLKNIMGMWLLQNIKKNLFDRYSYDELMKMAEGCGEHRYIDVNNPLFNAPQNMIDAVRQYLNEENLPLEVVINTVYHSLAQSYKDAVSEIEQICGKTYEKIHIVGGGSTDGYLNRLTADYTGKNVITGPVEATAIGNIVSQLIYSQEVRDLTEARELIKASFDIKEIK